MLRGFLSTTCGILLLSTANGLHAGIVTGPADLDLGGTIVFAGNLRTGNVSETVNSVTFTSLPTPGLAGVTASIPITTNPGEFSGNSPSFGASSSDDALERIYASLGYDNALAGTVSVDATVLSGSTYKVQLLFYEPYTSGRRFDVSVEGTVIFNEFDPYTAQGGTFASAYVYSQTYTATDNTLNILLTSGTTGSNNNPYLNGFIVTLVPEPSSFALATIGLVGLFGLRRKR